MPDVGQYDFFGSCDPAHSSVQGNNFSLGIFQWVEKAYPQPRNDRVKKGKVFSRVVGPKDDAVKVRETAARVCSLLNRGVVMPTELKKTIQWDSDYYIKKPAKR